MVTFPLACHVSMRGRSGTYNTVCRSMTRAHGCARTHTCQAHTNLFSIFGPLSRLHVLGLLLHVCVRPSVCLLQNALRVRAHTHAHTHSYIYEQVGIPCPPRQCHCRVTHPRWWERVHRNSLRCDVKIVYACVCGACARELAHACTNALFREVPARCPCMHITICK